MGATQSHSKRTSVVTKTSYRGALVSTLSGHSDAVLYCSFSPDGKLLATSSADQSVIVWDVKTFKRKHLLQNEHSHTADVSAACFSPDSCLLMSGMCV